MVGNPVRYMSVSVKPVGTSLNAAAPVQIFSHPVARNPFSSIFSLSTDGRFLLQVAANAAASAVPGTQTNAQPTASQAPITFVVGWPGTRP